MPSYHICGYIQFWQPQDLVARLWSCATAMIPFFCFCQPLDHYSLATGLPLVSFMMVCISFFHLYSWGCLPWSALFSQCVDSCCFGLLLGLFSFLFWFFFNISRLVHLLVLVGQALNQAPEKTCPPVLFPDEIQLLFIVMYLYQMKKGIL